MKHTRFELAELRDRQTGDRWRWEEFPMNTPVMLVRSGKRLKFKALRGVKRGGKSRPQRSNDNQLSLLGDTNAESTDTC